MQIKRRHVVDSTTIVELANNILKKRFKRNYPQFDTTLVIKAEDLQVYVDGPVTFAVIQLYKGNSSKECYPFTGWSKFNAEDKGYNEYKGIATALQRAVDAMMDAR